MKTLVAILLSCLLFGCATGRMANTNGQPGPGSAEDQAIQKALAGKPAELSGAYKRLYAEGDRNEVLNLMRLGTDAIQTDHLEIAKPAFNRAVDLITHVFADSEQAKNARSLWREEGSKIFKGEPYERVMAHYYSGLVYIWEQDYQNARARFQGGLVQDAFAEEEQYRRDFALLFYLSGWCSQMIGGDPYFGEQQFKQFHLLRQDIAIPAPDENVLVIFETGKAPRKLSDGVGHYQLKIRHGRHFREKRVRFSIDGGPMMDAYPVEDIYLQASTRGGRQFDYVLNGKAAFKKRTDAVGSALSEFAADAMIGASVFENGASQLQGIGAGLGIIGAVTQLASAKARTQADTRYWDNLPDTIHLASLELPAGEHQMEVAYCDLEGNEIPELRQKLGLAVPETGRLLEWARSRKIITSD
jgi:hypothetical protein